jgi:hypothetical protein
MVVRPGRLRGPQRRPNRHAAGAAPTGMGSGPHGWLRRSRGKVGGHHHIVGILSIVAGSTVRLPSLPPPGCEALPSGGYQSGPHGAI